MQKEKLGDYYDYFSRAEGSRNIASEYAIYKLVKLIEVFKPKNILEIGLGIGSISGCILAIKKKEVFTYHGTESNDFCLKSLKINLGENFNKLKVYKNLEDVPNKEKYDLVIVDGTDPHLEKVKKVISSSGIVTIEGDRTPQQEVLNKIFPQSKYVHSICTVKNKKNSPFSSDHWQGGIKIIFIDPTPHQYLWWVKEKIKTKIKYLYREYKN